jgi:uncharacterized membrane protein YgcG
MMMTRLLTPLVIVAGLLGQPAHAATSQERIVAELRDQGFGRIEIRRTLLGRVRIVATSRTYEREIILNPATGVILRDYWSAIEAGGPDGSGRPSGGSDRDDRSGSDSSGSGSDGGGGGGGGGGSSGGGDSSGASGDDDDDDDDSDDDDSDDDDDDDWD